MAFSRRNFQRGATCHSFRFTLPVMRARLLALAQAAARHEYGHQRLEVMMARHPGPGGLSNYGAGFGELAVLGSQGSFEVGTAVP